MDAAALAVLVEILDAGNLSEAARRLKMTRANVSYRLAQLERAVGLQLVRRTTRRVKPTEMGLTLYEHGRLIRQELQAAQEAVHRLSSNPHGRIRLSVPSGYGQLVMAPWLIEFKRLHPGVVLDVVFENRVEDLLRDEIDIAVRIMSHPPEGLVARELGAVRYVACASKGYAAARPMPVTPTQLGEVPLISSGVVGRHLRVSAQRQDDREDVTLEPTLVSENFLFLRSAVLADLGVGLLPDYVVADDISRGDVVTALDAWQISVFGTRMYMLYMHDAHQPRAMATFISFLLARARNARQDAGPSFPAVSAAS